MNICPICGFDRLSEPAYNIFEDGKFDGSYEICPSCGFETGIDEFDQNECVIEKYLDTCHLSMVKKYRNQWITNGMKWKHEDSESLKKRPKNWNPTEQLKNIPEEFR